MTLWQNIIQSPFPTIEGEFGCDGRTCGQRYSLNLGLPYTPTYLKVASMTAHRIELDIESGNFDETPTPGFYQSIKYKLPPKNHDHYHK